jgi:hypothetical protein
MMVLDAQAWHQGGPRNSVMVIMALSARFRHQRDYSTGARRDGDSLAKSGTNRGMANNKLSAKLQDWVEARKRFRLSHAHVQMARELGMNPRKLGKLANHDQEPWKAPLPQFIERLYLRSFGRERPEKIMSIEEQAAAQHARKAGRNEAKRRAQGDVHSSGEGQ